jgi:hypothetical protein
MMMPTPAWVCPAIVIMTTQSINSGTTMKQRSIIATLASFILAITCFAMTAFAQGNRTTVTKYDFENPSYYNPCCDEMISLAGTVHSSVKQTTNPDGSITITTHSNVSGVKGTGLSSGISYNASQSQKATQTVTPSAPCPYSFTQSLTVRLVGKGRGGHQCSFDIHYTVHFAVDADCNVTISDVDLEFDCANGTEISENTTP